MEGFTPRLSDSGEFMAGLMRSLNAVEAVRKSNVELRRRGRIAVFVAAVVGFVVGVALTLIMPYVGNIVGEICGSFLQIDALTPQIVTWLVVGATSVVTALNAYEITLARLSRKNV